MKVFVISDMEGIAGIVDARSRRTRAKRSTKRAASSTRRRSTRRSAARRRRARLRSWSWTATAQARGYDVQLAARRRSSTPDCEFVVQEEWTEYTEFPGAGRGRGAVRRDAREGGAPATACSTTRSRARTSRISGSTGRSSARPGSTPPSAAPGAARSLLVTGDRRGLPRRHRAPRRRPHHRRGEARTRP